MDSKICIKCKELKNIVDFSIRSDNGKYNNKCRKCVNLEYKNYSQTNRDKLKKYRENNKAHITAKKHEWYLANATTINHNRKDYRKKYYLKNKDLLNYKKKKYYEKNKKLYRSREAKYRKQRKNKDIIFRLRLVVSNSVTNALSNIMTSKQGKSCSKYLPYTIQELKQHLESKFESWMNWDNWGKYNSKTWNDQDPTTWKWNIDHIIPQSKLPYSSMEDDNFRKCWALDNLRPLSAKQNIIKRNNI